MKQKVVIRVSLNDQKKGRSKAMKIAVGLSGVESAALQGPEKDQIEVVGDGVDVVQLTTLLRKNVGHAELLSVGPASDKKPEATVKKNEATVMAPVVWTSYPPHDYGGVPAYAQFYEYPSRDPTCSIM